MAWWSSSRGSGVKEVVEVGGHEKGGRVIVWTDVGCGMVSASTGAEAWLWGVGMGA